MTMLRYHVVVRDLHKMKHRFLLRSTMAVCVTLMTLIGMVTVLHTEASGNLSEPVYKCYTSVAVEEGDTLWTLSDAYMGDRYPDKTAFIAEVRELNHLDEDMIRADSHIIIPYYKSF